MSNFKTTFRIEVALSKARRDGVDGVEMECQGVLPFVPARKMMIAPLNGDDLREVDRVYWMADAPDALEVWFKFDELNTAAGMRKLGWKEMT